ncbi:MAG: ATP-grasp domain-containing protein [bacterium]
MPPRKRILFLCPTRRDRLYLASLDLSKRYDIEAFGTEIIDPADFNPDAFLKALSRHAKKTSSPDGVVATDDYPASILASLAARRFKLPGPPPPSVFYCQHKYYSRLAQKKAVPEAVPDFALVSLKDQKAPLPFPFFMKPVKSYFSLMSQPIRSPREFQTVLKDLRKRLPPFVKTFSHLIPRMNSEIARPANGEHLIAEGMLDGHQVTLEGYAHRGKYYFIDVVDSLFYPGTRSFRCFWAPSRLPAEVQQKMWGIAERFMKSIGFDDFLFNVEFFYHPRKKTIHILEVNGRMASQFASLMQALHGTHTYEILMDLSVGKKPRFRRFAGKDRVAASFVLRTFEDRKAISVPGDGEVEKIKRLFPGSHVEILAKAGKRLSENHRQDEESYRYAIINLSAPNSRELQRRFRICGKELKFAFGPKL